MRKHDFDVDFDKFQTLFWIFWVICAALGIGFIGFVIWSIVMVMRYFGVV